MKNLIQDIQICIEALKHGDIQDAIQMLREIQQDAEIAQLIK